MIHIYFFIVGAILASFLGLVIDRFPETSIISPASHCDRCEKKLAPRDLVPIFSQIINRFQCRFCKAATPIWYLGLEISIGGLFLLWSLGYFPFSLLITLIAGLTLAIYDYYHTEYPLLVWLVFHLCLMGIAGWNALMLFFLLVGYLAHRFDIRIGAGDFLYLASLSLVLTFSEILILIQLSSATGILAFFFQKKKERLPFVPFLLLGLSILLIGKQLFLHTALF